MQKAIIATIALVSSATAAFAVPGASIFAPEIDAAAGVAALAALGGAVALVRERFKR